MSARRHLVWDWNGTLVDDLPLVVAATNAAFASVGGPLVTAEDHRRDFRRPIAAYYAQVLGRPVDDDEFAHLNKQFHDTYQAGATSCPLAPGAEEALHAWQERHGTQSLLSMWYHSDLVPTVAAYGLTGRFRRIDGLRGPATPAVAYKKPYLVEHLAALGLAGATVVLIGDTVDDARAAAAVGAGCVLYTGGFTDPEQLRSTGVPVVDHLRDAVSLAHTF